LIQSVASSTPLSKTADYPSCICAVSIDLAQSTERPLSQAWGRDRKRPRARLTDISEPTGRKFASHLSAHHVRGCATPQSRRVTANLRVTRRSEGGHPNCLMWPDRGPPTCGLDRKSGPPGEAEGSIAKISRARDFRRSRASDRPSVLNRRRFALSTDENLNLLTPLVWSSLSVDRQSPLIDRSRRENSAEHSWHVAMFALVLGQFVP
jgi:hypothetical protein